MALINYHGLVDPARIIHPAVSPLWIYCVSGDGRCWWILFSRGSPGSKGGSCIVGWWEALSLSGRGELGERRLLRERVVARLNAGGGRWNRGCYEDRHNAQRTTLHILRTRQNTAAHREQHTVWGRISCSSCASAGCVHVRSNKTPADQYRER